MPYDVSQLLKMTNEQFDGCFKAGAPELILNSEAKGTAIVASSSLRHGVVYRKKDRLIHFALEF
jgi:hypothetical protein